MWQSQHQSLQVVRFRGFFSACWPIFSARYIFNPPFKVFYVDLLEVGFKWLGLPLEPILQVAAVLTGDVAETEVGGRPTAGLAVA